jgi:hypothetical protein
MRAADQLARRLATTRLIEQAGLELLDSKESLSSIEEMLRGAATGPGGMALLAGEEIAIALMLIRRTAADGRDAANALHAAASLLRED